MMTRRGGWESAVFLRWKNWSYSSHEKQHTPDFPSAVCVCARTHTHVHFSIDLGVRVFTEVMILTST